MNIIEEKKKPRKFLMNEIKNLNDFLEHEKIIECSACKCIAIDPFFCKPCNVSFCQDCIYELKISSCPFCKLNKLVDAKLNFCQFFKDLCIKCRDCNELINYPQLNSHVCSNELKSSQNNPNPSQLINNQEADDIKYVDGVIHILCKNCLKFVPNPIFNSHICGKLRFILLL